ncbi:MAG TPA: Glu-tRNA(Gln) amidotransferase subunit GatE [candidate division WOR-3 bacterium]|uniref:Glu-tRNA(Gln) amidotransferase subunit GatE n=1 Tax=candidate division WOR-3 bacterium TaxID=2052148 RepID=A0A7V0XFG2_UNCW3|nr:Glu-tRNA(Gln) amidotransferase subunit GatE [candidate division WOR-3 bacterium]
MNHTDVANLDWRSLGLKVGHEVHYQLRTRRKLFCRCPAEFRHREPDYEVLRHMRPTLSELGEYDGTALMEFKTKKNVRYQLYADIDCTYEMDDTPPFPINGEALDIALRIGLLLNLNIVDEMHISRKQYLDGSIPTGFQRTAIIGVEGWVPFRGRKLGIIQLGLEEDACREVSDVGHDIVYRADRLGFPLVEVVTDATMHTPEEASAGARLIWRLLRSTGQVRTGPGAGRQDVNVSINGSTRVEIKGVPDTGLIRRLVAVEAFRQQQLLAIRDELRARGVSPESLKLESRELDRATVLGTGSPYLRRAADAGESVAAVRLAGFAGLLNRVIEPGLEFGYEFSERVRVIACLDRMPNIIYRGGSDEGLTDEDWGVIRELVNCGVNDEAVLAWGPAPDLRTAVNEIHLRAVDAAAGVPSETRQPHPDGTTGFERILPGPDRMYPDTDSPPTAISRERLDEIRKALPEPAWRTEERFRALGLPEDVAQSLVFSPRRGLFEKLTAGPGADPKLLGVALEQWSRWLSRQGFAVRQLSDEALAGLFERYRKGGFGREAIVHLMRGLCRGGALDALLAARGLGEVITGRKLETLAAAALKGATPDYAREPEACWRFLMGRAMRELRGRAQGRDVAAAVRKLAGR